jgi:uncharacterized repeat protein (TIGR03803 family)
MSSAKPIRRHSLPPSSPLTTPLAFTLLLTALLALTPATAAAQTFSLLYQFKAGPNGSNPYASLILDAKGNLYGTTTIDGAYSYGTVFRVTPAGKETVLHSFTGIGGDGAFPYSPLVRDSSGNLYGTTEFGGLYGGSCGANGCGIVFKLDSTGKETVLYRFAGYPADGQMPLQGLVRDSAGNLYGTTFQGGAYGGGTVFQIGPAGAEIVLHNFNLNGIDGYDPFGGSLLRDSAGNLYGTTELGGSQFGGTVFRLAPNGEETILHNFNYGSNTDGYFPYGTLAVDSERNLYGVTNFGGAFLSYGAVFKVSVSGNETLLYSFSGTGGDGAVPGGGLVRDSAGNLYGTTNSGGDSYFGTVFKLDPSGTETILHSFSGSDGKLPDFGLVRDSAGNLYGTTQNGGAYGGGVVFKVTP